MAACSDRRKNWIVICGAAAPSTPEAIRELEARLAVTPNDPELRVAMVGALYLATDSITVGKRVAHLTWLARHRPEIGLGGFSFVPDLEEREEYPELRQIWLDALADHAGDVRVLASAGTFFSYTEPEIAVRAYEQAAAIEPEKMSWRLDIARAHRRLVNSAADDADKQRHLQAEAAALKEALARATRDDQRSVVLCSAAQNAVLSAHWDDAHRTARQILDELESCRDTWQYGNAIHHAHVALGHVAFARGDLAEAERELLRAGETPGSPQLNSFGPDLELAAILLKQERRDAVIAYLELCRTFWEEPSIEDWLLTLRQGGTPDIFTDD